MEAKISPTHTQANPSTHTHSYTYAYTHGHALTPAFTHVYICTMHTCVEAVASTRANIRANT